MNLTNISSNKKSSKKRDFNSFGTVTELVKKYKVSKSNDDMLLILDNLQGIINTYTLICTPPDSQQSMFITPYMKKFLGMFLTPEERVGTTNMSYMHAAQRVRWILRHYTYEDMYNKLLEILIEIVQKMKVIGDCDCIYFIQKMTQYKMYDLVRKSSNDLTAHVQSIIEHKDIDSSNYDEDEYRFNNKSINDFYDKDKDINVEIFYGDVNINSLFENFDFYRYLTQYEKLLLYLSYGTMFTVKQISFIVRHKTEKEIHSDMNNLNEKLMAFSQEHKTI